MEKEAATTSSMPLSRPGNPGPPELQVIRGAESGPPPGCPGAPGHNEHRLNPNTNSTPYPEYPGPPRPQVFGGVELGTTSGGSAATNGNTPTHSAPKGAPSAPEGAEGGFLYISTSDDEAEGKEINTDRTMAIQWNLCGLSARFPELVALTHRLDPLFIALQEVQTRSIEAKKRLEQQGHVWRFDHPAGEASVNGVALGIRRDIGHVFLDLDTRLQAVAATVDWPTKMTVVSVYLSKQDGKAEIENKLRKLLTQLPKPLMILGDFNAHSDLWGGSHTDCRGKAIENLLNEFDLLVLNTGEHTRIDISNGKTSAIDLTIVSSVLARRIGWEPLAECCGSDHFPIILRELGTGEGTTRRRRRWRYDEARWEDYTNALKEQQHSNLADLENAIIAAANTHIPRTSGNVGKKAVHWWSAEVEAAVKHRRKMLRKLRKMSLSNPGRNETLKAFQAARGAARSVIKEAKAKSWAAFVTGISPECSSREIWRRVNTFRSGKKAEIRRLVVSGETISDPHEVATRLAEDFRKISSNEDLHPLHIGKRNDTKVVTHFERRNDDFYNVDFSREELS